MAALPAKSPSAATGGRPAPDGAPGTRPPAASGAVSAAGGPPPSQPAPAGGTGVVAPGSAPAAPPYDPRGKPDPFRPFVARVETKAVGPVPPLQRYDLSQLRLVGILWGKDETRALIEDPTGQGHTIKRGSVVGRNSGRVLRVTSESVTVEERTRDPITGEAKTATVSLKLPVVEATKR